MPGGGDGRLSGVGFLVGAKDDGATETFEDVAEGADRLADAAERAGEKSRDVGLLRRAIEGLNAINISNISDQLANIAERAGVGVGAQATALESFGAQFGQTARAAEARLGSMSGAMRAHRGEVSSLAYAYGVSGDEMFAAMAPLSRLGVDINEVFGENSARALAGHLQAGIVSGQAFGNVLSELVGVYGMQADSAGTMVDSLFAIGDRFGFVAEIGQGLPSIMDAIRPVAARYPTIAEDVDGVATSITRLAAGMVNMGMAPDQALQAATQTFTSLGEQRDALEGLVTGLGTEFPQLAQQIGISTGDIQGSIAAVMSSPVEFAQRMGEAMRSAGEDSVFGRRLAASLREISPELLNVVRNTAQGGDALRAATEPIEGVEDAFNRAGQSALTSTLTFSEQLDRMQDAFQTRMNAIGRATDRDFVGRQRRAYQEVGDRLERWAGDSGPLGALTRGFLRVRTFGLVQGLLPQFGALTGELGESVAAAGPFLHTMNQLGSMRSVSAVLGRVAGGIRVVGTRMLTVLGPIGLLVGAGVLLYRYWDRLPGLFDGIEERLRGAADWFKNISDRFVNWVARVDWADVGARAMDMLFDAITGTIEAMSGAGGGGGGIAASFRDSFIAIFSSLGTMFMDLGRGIWNRLKEGFQTEMSGGAGVAQRMFGTMFSTIMEHVDRLRILFTDIRNVVEPVWDSFQEALPAIGDDFQAVWQSANSTFGDLFEAIREIGGVFWELWTDTFSPVFSQMLGVFSSMFGGGREGVSGQADNSFKNVSSSARSMWQGGIRPVLIGAIRFFANFFNYVQANGIRMFGTLAMAGANAFNNIWTGIERVRNAWAGLQNIMRTGWEAIQSTTEAIIGNTLDFVDLTFQRMVHGWDRLIMNLKVFLATTLQSMLDNINTLVSNIPAGVRRVIPGLDAFAQGVGRAHERIGQTVTDLQERNTEMLREQRQEERELQNRMADRQRQMLEDRRAAIGAAAQTTAADMLIRARGQARETQIRNAWDTLMEGVGNAGQQLNQVADDLESGALGRQRATRRFQADQQRIAQQQAEQEAGAMNLNRLSNILGDPRARQRLGQGGVRALREAIATRGAGGARAFDERELENVMARLGSIARGPQRGRAQAISALSEMIAQGRRVTAGREDFISGTAPRRGGGARRAVQRAAAAGGATPAEIRDAVRAGAAQGTQDGVQQAARNAPVPPRQVASAPTVPIGGDL